MLKPSVTSVLINDRHITVASAPYIRQIAAEMFKKLDVTGFRHVRLYDDNCRFELTADEVWFIHFMKNGYFNFTRLDRNASCYQSGYFLWDAWNKDCQAYDIVYKDAIENFEGGRGISILRRAQSWVDKYEFSTSVHNHAANETFLSNIEVMDNFIDYYLVVMADLIKQAHEARQKLPYSIDPYKEYEDTFLPSEILATIKSPKTVIAGSINLSLTKRELDCLYWLNKGKTVPEIAAILNISNRTVEKFILGIKDKFNCRSFFQIGQIFQKLRMDLFLKPLW